MPFPNHRKLLDLQSNKGKIWAIKPQPSAKQDFRAVEDRCLGLQLIIFSPEFGNGSKGFAFFKWNGYVCMYAHTQGGKKFLF